MMLLKDLVVPLGQPGISVFAGVASAWAQGRFNRKARGRVGDVEAEARTPEEVVQMLKQLMELRGSTSKDTKES